MKLREFEGKELFKKYGIPTPKSVLIAPGGKRPAIETPVFLKAQVLSGDRKRYGGIVFVDKGGDVNEELNSLFAKEINGERVERILVEEPVNHKKEYYASISYDTATRGPVLAVAQSGGSGINKARTYPLNILEDKLPEVSLNVNLADAGFDASETGGLSEIIQNLWRMFLTEYALLAEINPIFKTASGRFIAGDAKVIIDDERINPNEKRFISMGGDIAILASGGGASMLNIDSLLRHGGEPANYAEYSGNPKADVVKTLTKKVLEQKGINGLWVIGGTANFTDIYETMRGFIEGLETVNPKPEYPILIRRDGPRQKEAREMIEKFAAEKGYSIKFYGPELSMDESAKLIVKLAHDYKRKISKI